LKIITFYADCLLPDRARNNQQGFDWRGAIRMLEKSAARFGYQTLIVTDRYTAMDAPWLRYGNALEDGLMMWLLRAQAAAMNGFDGEQAVMVSPDTLIAGKLDFLFGDWDVSLLTRRKPKPIINSVIGFRPSYALTDLWKTVVDAADCLPDESKQWGADIDAVVDVLEIQPMEDGVREIAGVKARLVPVTSRFQSIPKTATKPFLMPDAIWDFKGARKAMMPKYARLIDAHI
jgi:hypothetical protein